jgi:release factor glutamine methyltransferase
VTQAVPSGGWLGRAARQLAAAGVPTPDVDAAILAEECTGARREQLGALDDPGPVYWALVERRAGREPLQHVLGRAWFRHVEVVVGPGVFVPRPETELVAGTAVAEAAALAARGRRPVVVDLGTGSGVIALSVRAEVPDAVVHAVESETAAWGWAQRNCSGSGVLLHRADLADCLPHLDGGVDVVVSNPPYIPPDGVPRDPEVRDHDPPTALYGAGPDGLGHVRAVITRAAGLLRPGGLLVVEHADTQATAVTRLLRDWDEVHGCRDLAGRDRYVTARRPVDP